MTVFVSMKSRVMISSCAFYATHPLGEPFCGASPAREWKEQSHAGRAPTIYDRPNGQSGINQNNPFTEISLQGETDWYGSNGFNLRNSFDRNETGRKHGAIIRDRSTFKIKFTFREISAWVWRALMKRMLDSMNSRVAVVGGGRIARIASRN